MLNQFDDQEYIFIHLIGSIPYENKNTDKINGYYQISNGILIRDLAINFLNVDSEHVKVLAYGNKQYYNKFIHTNNKYYFQIDKNNIFQIDSYSSRFNFEYVTDFSKSLETINQMISDNKYSTIVLFLEDNDNEGHFSNIEYFQLYKMILNFPNNEFLIFNDSCNSGSMIDLVKSYNKIYESEIFKDVPTEVVGQILFSFMNLFTAILDCHKNSKTNDIIEEAKRLINYIEETIIVNDTSTIKSLNLNKQSGLIFDELSKLIGLNDDQDIEDFRIIYKSFESIENENDLSTIYNKIKRTFNQINLEKISKIIDKDIHNFIDTIKILHENRKIIDFNLPPHPNIEIITSTDAKNICFSYASIRINEVAKVNPGSPAMSAFIKEIFFKSDKTPLNFVNIQKEMTEADDKLILYPVKPDKKIIKKPKKRQWIGLFPQHYKSNEKSSYSFVFDDNVFLKVATLRNISFLLNQKLLQVAKFLTPKIDFYDLNSFSDSFADIVAISAILYKCKEAIPIIKNHIVVNHIFLDRKSIGIKTISTLFYYSFTFSEEPIKMTAIILNCLQRAVRNAICENIILIQENKEPEKAFKQTLLNSEISLLKANPTHKNINDETNLIEIFSPDQKYDKKYRFLASIENAIFSLLNPQSILPTFIIASILTKEYKDEFIQKNKKYLQFYQKEIVNIKNEEQKLQKIKEFSECYLLSQIKSSLEHLNLICNAYFTNEVMRKIAQELQFYSTLFLMNKITEYLGDSINKEFVEFIINPIEDEVSKLKISTFIIPLIVSMIDKKVIIYALYSCFSKLQNDWYQKVFEILNQFQDIIIEKYYNDLIQMSEKLLSDLKDKSYQEEKVEQMKNEILKEIQYAIILIDKFIVISTKKARESICKKMNLEIIRNQIDQYKLYLKSIEQNKYKNKYHKYLYSSIKILDKMYANYFNAPECQEIESKGFNADKTLTNTKNLYERAAKELYTLAYLFDISDKPCSYINKNTLNRIDNKSILIFAASTMAARYFNIVEMTPIIDKLEQYITLFNKSDGDKPTIKELMSLHAATILVLSPKDKKRRRYINQNEIENNKKNDNDEKNENHDKIGIDEKNVNDEKNYNNEIENDSYYSDDYYEEIDDIPHRSFQLGLNDEISFYNNTYLITIQPSKVYHKDQIYQSEIESIRKELKLGHGDWVYEAWIAFVYCFNKRLSYLKIQFDPKDDYKDAKYRITIGEALLIIEQFYPIYRIRNFWTNEERIRRFVGKYSNYHREILRALVRCFDDVDRIVTPLHMFQETYEERTQEKLNLIFEY